MQLTYSVNPRDPSEIRTVIGQLTALLATFTGEAASAPAAAPADATPRPTRGKKVDAAPPAQTAPVADEGFGDEPPAQATAQVVDIPTPQQVTDITIALGKAGKLTEVVALLKKHNVARASLLEEHQRAAYIADAKAILGGS